MRAFTLNGARQKALMMPPRYRALRRRFPRAGIRRDRLAAGAKLQACYGGYDAMIFIHFAFGAVHATTCHNSSRANFRSIPRAPISASYGVL